MSAQESAPGRRLSPGSHVTRNQTTDPRQTHVEYHGASGRTIGHHVAADVYRRRPRQRRRHLTFSGLLAADLLAWLLFFGACAAILLVICLAICMVPS